MVDISDIKLRKCFSGYQNPEKTKREVLSVVKTYKGLQIEQETYVFIDGSQKALINLSGTIPIQFKAFIEGHTKRLAVLKGTIPIYYEGQYYHIPICIWLMDTHPNNAPICYVKPTAEMRIKQSMHIDLNGKIYSPYLHDWAPDKSRIEELISQLIRIFSENPPLYSQKKQEMNSSPYPIQSFMPMPGSNAATPYPVYPNSSSAYPGYNPNAAAAGGTGAGIYPNYPSNVPIMYPNRMPQPMPVPNPIPTPPTSDTITDKHIKMSLKSAVEDKMRRKINEHTEQTNEEIEILKQTGNELNQGKTKLLRIIERIDKEKVDLERNITYLKEKETELDTILSSLTENKEINVDDAVTTTAPIYKQILQTFTEEAATEDTIYYMGEALLNEVIDLEAYLKQVRALSRKQFMLRALLFKCYKHVQYLR